jgi:DNA-binding transcriptional LysR family regulator
LTLQQLRDFLAVIAHGGFRPAARVLGVAQAGLTKSVARLEEEHGVVLIERSASGATLTALGVEFHRLAAAVALEADRAEAWLREAGTAKAGPPCCGSGCPSSRRCSSCPPSSPISGACSRRSRCRSRKPRRRA